MAKGEERIDKWLWAMRVFKTRTISTDACKKGRVTMNGSSLKPSRTIKPGDVVDVKKPPRNTATFLSDTLRPSSPPLAAIANAMRGSQAVRDGGFFVKQ